MIYSEKQYKELEEKYKKELQKLKKENELKDKENKYKKSKIYNQKIKNIILFYVKFQIISKNLKLFLI